jgi:cell division protein FtsB
MPMRVKFSLPGRRVLLAVLGLGLLALVVHTVFGEKGYVSLRRQQQELERLQGEIQHLEEENRHLIEEIQTLKTDPRAVERVAREELKMARPGEKVIILPSDRGSSTDTESAEEEGP